MPNLLEREDSPYLLQHKDNPINWHPWRDEAFVKAESENKTIFISIGYSTCHWCHVMEREVFEDVEMAAFMNARFVCIKVDKEERPDIDQYYQNVYAKLNKKSGGWPTSIFCTPQNKPFFAATYIPLEPKYNIVGFRDLTRLIYEKISTKDAALFKNAAAFEESLLQDEKPQNPQSLNISIAQKFIAQCENNFEPTYGGFTIATKFPQVATLNAMMSLYELQKNDELKSMITHTLDNMIAGGFYDLVDGGFCRYSVGAEWLVPHFEKMTYDNGLLCKLYLRAFMLFKTRRYFEVAREVVAFARKFMMEGSFIHSASDADTNGVEGEYYVYSRKEVLSAIKASGYSESEAKRMAMRLLVSSSGNFEGKNIMRFANIQKEEWFDNVRAELQKARESREYPFIDKRIQTSWSAMMIEAFFSFSLYEKSCEELARQCLKSLLEKTYDDKSVYHACKIDAIAKPEGYLEDYAYLSKTLLYAYEVTADEEYLKLAEAIVKSALRNYHAEGVWKFSVGEFETFAEIEDGSYPSCVGVIIESLLSLGTLVCESYRDVALKSFERYNAQVTKNPILHASMTEQIIRFIHEDRVLKAPYGSNYLEAKEHYKYPFFHLKYHTREFYELCSNSSCFAKSDRLPTADSVSS